MEENKAYDVTILGGGLAGLTLARQLSMSRPQTRILVLEKNSFPVPEAAFKVGESSVEIGAWYFERVLDFGDHIKQDQLPKFGLRFFFSQPGSDHIADGLELGLRHRFTTPSYQIDRGRFENHIAKTLVESGISLRDQSKVKKVNINDEQNHQVQYVQDGQSHQVESRWVIDATSRAAILKRQLGLKKDIPHKINAVWFRVEQALKIDEWGEWSTTCSFNGEELERWLSTNHLMGPGYWVWLIPLASGCTSVGIVADPNIHPLSEINSIEKSLKWLAHHQPQCAAQIDSDKVMDFIAIKNFTHGCEQVFSPQRWALTGEAGVFLDPFYSPGSDFIGISNTFITALIEREMRGRPIDAQVFIFEQLYQSLFENTLLTYKDQYPLFGNPKIMSVKVMWDYAVYWSFPAFVFCLGKLTTVKIFPRIRETIDALGQLNRDIQAFFRHWHQAHNHQLHHTFVDQGAIKLLEGLNHNLSQPLDDDAFVVQLSDNLDRLFELAWEIVEEAKRDDPDLAQWTPEDLKPSNTNHFTSFFKALRQPELQTAS